MCMDHLITAKLDELPKLSNLVKELVSKVRNFFYDSENLKIKKFEKRSCVINIIN